MQKLHLYSRFERFWHWSQALLVILLILSGFELHGTWRLWGFGAAYSLHITCGWLLAGLIAFAIFWHFTTGEWRQYIPTFEKLKEMLVYYAGGMFQGKPHPFEKTADKKLNPLQRWAYFKLKVIFFPVQLVSGFLLLTYNDWNVWGMDLHFEPVALLHTLVGFAFLAFLIIHSYLITTGHTVFSHLKAMVVGYEEVAG